jgi:lipopolysaccharide transport system permease protein
MTARADREWIENRPDGRRRIDLAELWQYRELVGFFAIRDVKVRYKQAALGASWAVLQPVAGAVVFTVLFGRLVKAPSDGVPYLLFAFAGVSLWSYFSSSITNATSSLVGNVSLVTKVYFPRLAAPVAAVLPGLVDLGVALVILAVLMVAFSWAPTLAILTLPFWILATVLLALGVGLGLATLNVRYRDVKNAIGLFMQLWLFVSPVGYSSELIHGNWRYLYYLNPMAGIVDGFRWSLFGRPTPTWFTAISFSVLVLALWGGCRLFAQGERRFADVI